jgi:hypothetical protein
LVNQITGAGTQCEHESRRRTHAYGGFQFFGNAEKRAHAQNFRHYDIIDEYRTDQNQ